MQRNETVSTSVGFPLNLRPQRRSHSESALPPRDPILQSLRHVSQQPRRRGLASSCSQKTGNPGPPPVSPEARLLRLLWTAEKENCRPVPAPSEAPATPESPLELVCRLFRDVPAPATPPSSPVVGFHAEPTRLLRSKSAPGGEAPRSAYKPQDFLLVLKQIAGVKTPERLRRQRTASEEESDEGDWVNLGTDFAGEAEEDDDEMAAEADERTHRLVRRLSLLLVLLWIGAVVWAMSRPPEEGPGLGVPLPKTVEDPVHMAPLLSSWKSPDTSRGRSDAEATGGDPAEVLSAQVKDAAVEADIGAEKAETSVPPHSDTERMDTSLGTPQEAFEAAEEPAGDVPHVRRDLDENSAKAPNAFKPVLEATPEPAGEASDEPENPQPEPSDEGDVAETPQAPWGRPGAPAEERKKPVRLTPLQNLSETLTTGATEEHRRMLLRLERLENSRAKAEHQAHMTRILDDLEAGDASLLDTLNSYLAGRLIGRAWVPRTDRECRFFWRSVRNAPKTSLQTLRLGLGVEIKVPGCLPHSLCEWRPRFGDAWPSRSCRLRLDPLPVETPGEESPVLADTMARHPRIRLDVVWDGAERFWTSLPEMWRKLRADFDALPSRLMRWLSPNDFEEETVRI